MVTQVNIVLVIHRKAKSLEKKLYIVHIRVCQDKCKYCHFLKNPMLIFPIFCTTVGKHLHSSSCFVSLNGVRCLQSLELQNIMAILRLIYIFEHTAVILTTTVLSWAPGSILHCLQFDNYKKVHCQGENLQNLPRNISI